MLSERQIAIRKNKIAKLLHVQKFRKLNMYELDELDRLQGEIEEHASIDTRNLEPNEQV